MLGVLTLTLLIILKQLPGYDSVIPDPCPNIDPSTKVADMCRDNYAVEGTEDGGDRDSVVVRVMTNDNNCICLVNVNNPISDSTALYISRLDVGSLSSDERKCGPTVQIAYRDMNGIKINDSMTCHTELNQDVISLIKEDSLELKSLVRENEENFTQGYCIDIRKASNQYLQTLSVSCGTVGVIPSTRFPPSSSSMTESVLESSTATDVSEENSVVYIAIGASVGVVVLAIIIVLILVFYKRKILTKKSSKREKVSEVTNNQTDDDEYNGLKYNVLYMTSEQQDVTDVDYTSVDLDRSPSSERKGECQIEEHGRYITAIGDFDRHQKLSKAVENGSFNKNSDIHTSKDNMYAVVNKKGTK